MADWILKAGQCHTIYPGVHYLLTVTLFGLVRRGNGIIRLPHGFSTLRCSIIIHTQSPAVGVPVGIPLITFCFFISIKGVGVLASPALHPRYIRSWESFCVAHFGWSSLFWLFCGILGDSGFSNFNRFYQTLPNPIQSIKFLGIACVPALRQSFTDANCLCDRDLLNYILDLVVWCDPELDLELRICPWSCFAVDSNLKWDSWNSFVFQWHPVDI